MKFIELNAIIYSTSVRRYSFLPNLLYPHSPTTIPLSSNLITVLPFLRIMQQLNYLETATKMRGINSQEIHTTGPRNLKEYTKDFLPIPIFK